MCPYVFEIKKRMSCNALVFQCHFYNMERCKKCKTYDPS